MSSNHGAHLDGILRRPDPRCNRRNQSCGNIKIKSDCLPLSFLLQLLHVDVNKKKLHHTLVRETISKFIMDETHD